MPVKRRTKIDERVCQECKEIIHLTRGSYENILFFDNNYYHKSCFLPMCERKAKNKRSSPKWKEALEDIDELELKAKENIDYAFEKDDVYRFMLSFYDTEVISSRVFDKLDAIYSGELEGLYTPIPPTDLYDMWVRKKDYLIKLRSKNTVKGKKFSTEQKIMYDLSVLVNKYDSYRKWKEQQKILEQQTETNAQILQDINLHSSYYNPNKNSNINNKNNNDKDEDDIDSLLDEIFN